MKKTTATLIFCCLLSTAWAYKYGEHKEIGDQAFARFLLTLRSSGGDALFFRYINMTKDSLNNSYFFNELCAPGGNGISYGVLNALSGDHESNPLLLDEQLRSRNSVLQHIASLHNKYIAMGYTAAPDSKLTTMDFSYALLAAINLDHFYVYGKSFQAQLKPFDKKLIRECENPALVKGVFKKLSRTNAINMYVTLHCLAIDLAEQSGKLSQNDPANAARLLYYAFLFNAFADHFLEDSFAAGHLVVNRTILESFTNNKALHDFYCENGSPVVNLRGQIWKAYGDGQFNNTHSAWQQQTRLQDIHYASYTAESERIIEAVRLSIAGVWDAFQQSSTNAGHTSFLSTIPDKINQQEIYLIRNTPSLQFVPIPYNSDLKTIVTDPSIITDSMKNANQLLYYRNFVRSRVANSFVISFIGGGFSEAYFHGREFRINAGSFSKKYSYNTKGEKKGVVDYWLGYTLSYSKGTNASISVKQNTSASLLKAGLRSNVDWWITNRKFLGIYNYTEIGAQFTDEGTKFVFSPSVGIQLGSLFNIDYYNMPGWLRIPAQYLLPLQLRYGMIILNHDIPRYFSGADLTLFF